MTTGQQGDEDAQRTLTILTTEHYNSQSARSATIGQGRYLIEQLATRANIVV